MKYRWEVMGESDEEKDLADVAIEAVLSKKENEAINAEIDEENQLTRLKLETSLTQIK